MIWKIQFVLMVIALVSFGYGNILDAVKAGRFLSACSFCYSGQAKLNCYQHFQASRASRSLYPLFRDILEQRPGSSSYQDDRSKNQVDTARSDSVFCKAFRSLVSKSTNILTYDSISHIDKKNKDRDSIETNDRKHTTISSSVPSKTAGLLRVFPLHVFGNSGPVHISDSSLSFSRTASYANPTPSSTKTPGPTDEYKRFFHFKEVCRQRKRFIEVCRNLLKRYLKQERNTSNVSCSIRTYRRGCVIYLRIMRKPHCIYC